MAIIIKGMDMPKSCAECPLYETIDWCELDWKTVFDAAESGERAEDCPLAEIPTPHGRLIDADRLTRKEIRPLFYHLPNGDIAVPLIDIEHAPTVIESEE